MGWFSRSGAHEQEVLNLLATVGRLNQENERLKGEIADVQELVRHQDQDLLLLMGAAQRLRPGLDTAELASALLDLCFRPLDLASFYVALMDWSSDELRFPLYHEGGRNRNHPARKLSIQPGLTGRTFAIGAPYMCAPWKKPRSMVPSSPRPRRAAASSRPPGTASPSGTRPGPRAW